MKKKPSQDESGGGANWMDTYGDLVTLLLCFFVLLYSFSTIDAEKWQELVMSFSGAGAGIMDHNNGIGEDDPSGMFQPFETSPPTVTPGVSPSPTPTATPTPSPTPQPTPTLTPSPSPKPTKRPKPTATATPSPVPAYITEMENLSDEIAAAAADSSLGPGIIIERGESSIRIRLVASVIFEPGSDRLLPEAETLLQNVSDTLSPYASLVTSMHTEGHTDSVSDIDEDMSSKWDLASRRATRVLEFLLGSSGVSPSVSYTQGYGDQRPIASNDTEEGRDQNNRVDIVISSRPK